MLEEVIINLWVGDNGHCNSIKFDAIIHAKKECWKSAGGKNSLHLRKDNQLYIDMIDGRDTTFSTEMFTGTFDFITEYLSKEKKVLIHCNEARSRSPAIALAYLTFVKEIFSKTNYRKAREDFYGIYPNFQNSNAGIDIFLRKNWHLFPKS